MSVITLTEAACSRIRALRSDTTAPTASWFRVYITGGGCSGFQYKFMLDEQQSDDILVTQDDISLVIDALTLPYLQGAVIDYKKDLRGAQFAVNNPNATTTCSCGSSFSVD